MNNSPKRLRKIGSIKIIIGMVIDIVVIIEIFKALIIVFFAHALSPLSIASPNAGHNGSIKYELKKAN